MLTNTPNQFGLISIVIHWITALAVIGLFILGVYMVDLNYYSPWYNKAPHIHESIGVLLFAVMVIRIVLRILNPPPDPLKSLKRWEQRLAPVVHGVFYFLIFTVLITGYLISSAGENSVAVFDWFTLPAVATDMNNQQDVAGVWHLRIAWGIIILTALHTLAALKHHFVDKDTTLLRMLKTNRKSNI